MIALILNALSVFGQEYRVIDGYFCRDTIAEDKVQAMNEQASDCEILLAKCDSLNEGKKTIISAKDSSTIHRKEESNARKEESTLSQKENKKLRTENKVSKTLNGVLLIVLLIVII